MLTGVCINPCIDRTITVSSFEYGGTNRVIDISQCPGGKAINVARAASRLGVCSNVTGFLFEDGGDVITNTLRKENITNHMMTLPGRLRVNLKIFEQETAVVTELNEKGPATDGTSIVLLREKITQLAKDARFMVLAGSVPERVHSDEYRRMTEIAQYESCEVVLDAEGDLFKNGIEAKPMLVKPNRHELETYIGSKLIAISEIKDAAETLIQQGVRMVLVSLGEDGAVFVDGKTALHAKGMKVHAINTVGAGDSMVAGALTALSQNANSEGVLKLAVACATASVTQEGTGLTDISDVKKIAKEVKVIAL